MEIFMESVSCHKARQLLIFINASVDKTKSPQLRLSSLYSWFPTFPLISIQKAVAGAQGCFIGDVKPIAQNTKYPAAAQHYIIDCWRSVEIVISSSVVTKTGDLETYQNSYHLLLVYAICTILLFCLCTDKFQADFASSTSPQVDRILSS